MIRWLFAAALLVGLAALPRLHADDTDGFVPLFNGRDLTGWVNVNCHPSTFFVKNGEIVTTGQPIGYLRTAKQYENFIAEFEWMHVNKKEVGNSGFFVWGDGLPMLGGPFTRGIEVQVLVNLERENAYTSHGDVFSIQGATCKPDRPHPMGWARCLPSERRCKGGGEWNHYRIVANNGTIKLSVNGKEVSGVSACNPRKGYLALESEGAECHFRNLKIKELPSTNPRPNEVAESADGFVSLFTGLDLAGWKADAGHKGHWRPAGGRLHYDGKATAPDKNLWTTAELGDGELVVDFRLPPKGKDGAVSGVALRGSVKNAVAIARGERGSGAIAGTTVARKADRPAGQWNRLHLVLKGDRVTVKLNGDKVVDQARLPEPRDKGPIALLDGGAEVEFANIFIREAKP